MAYRFNGTTDTVAFALAPFSGYTFGPVTEAVLLKRNVVQLGALNIFVTSGNSGVFTFRINTSPAAFEILTTGTNGCSSSQNPSSTSLWYLLAMTWAGSGLPRFHMWDGTSWSHANGTNFVGGGPATYTLTGTDFLRFGSRSGFLSADVVCTGIKKANSSDAAIETLNPLYFSTWRAFAFDWLIGFDSTLVTGGLLQDQATPGTGDETSRTGTSLVSDPPGWSWTAAAPPPPSTFVPQIAIIG